MMPCAQFPHIVAQEHVSARSVHCMSLARQSQKRVKQKQQLSCFTCKLPQVENWEGNHLWITEMTPPTHLGSIMLRPSLLVHFDQGYLGMMNDEDVF